MTSIRFRIDFGGDLHVGPGKIALLEAIAECGSLNSAAKAAGLSYRRAWLLLDSVNKTFERPVVESIVGGKRGGGSSVTEFGRLLIQSYRHLKSQISAASTECLRPVLPHMVRNAPSQGLSRQRLAQQVVVPKPKKSSKS